MAQNFDINPYQQAIELIIEAGHSVLQVFPFNESNAYYYLVHQFIVAQKTPTDDIQYNQAVGINITKFIEQNSFINKIEFMRKFENYISSEYAKVTRIEFPNTMSWFKFGFVS